MIHRNSKYGYGSDKVSLESMLDECVCLHGRIKNLREGSDDDSITPLAQYEEQLNYEIMFNISNLELSCREIIKIQHY